MEAGGAPGERVDEVGELGDWRDVHAAQVGLEAVADRLQADCVHGQRLLLLLVLVLLMLLLLERRRRSRVRRRSCGGRHHPRVLRGRGARAAGRGSWADAFSLVAVADTKKKRFSSAIWVSGRQFVEQSVRR